MDLSLLSKETCTIDIKNPENGEFVGVTVEVRSNDSEQVKFVHRKFQNRALAKRGEGFDSEDIEDQSINLLIAAVASWEWSDDIKWRGEKPDNVNSDAFKREVLGSREGAFIARQIDKAMSEESNFFGC
jgi:hypothetical protein